MVQSAIGFAGWPIMADTILITGARSAVALDLARDFAAGGFQVHMADCSSSFLSRWSKIPTRVHRAPTPLGGT